MPAKSLSSADIPWASSSDGAGARRPQVQFQLREREENEDLDPRLNAQCGTDIHKLCRDESETKGSGKVRGAAWRPSGGEGCAGLARAVGRVC